MVTAKFRVEIPTKTSWVPRGSCWDQPTYREDKYKTGFLWSNNEHLQSLMKKRSLTVSMDDVWEFTVEALSICKLRGRMSAAGSENQSTDKHKSTGTHQHKVYYTAVSRNRTRIQHHLPNSTTTTGATSSHKWGGPLVAKHPLKPGYGGDESTPAVVLNTITEHRP
jgi:hypothetical protein